MSDFFNFFKDLNKQWKEIIYSLFFLGCFWVVPFCLFKPEVFEFPFYAQLALIFSLTLIWLIISLLTSIYVLHIIDEHNKASFILSALIGIVLLNISILISYYYSDSFTFFLRIAFSVILLYCVAQILIYLFVIFYSMF